MPIVRGTHGFDERYTPIPNRYLRDARISLAARGLYAQLLSHRPGWQVSQESLARDNGIGRDAMRTLINELIDAGYLHRSAERERNSAGQLSSYRYTTCDPGSDEPTLDEPTQAEPTHKKTIIKKTIIKNSNASDARFEEFYNAYPLKRDKGRALRAFNSALKRASAETIIAGAIAYRDDPTRKPDYTKYPATWLNADAWENEVITPKAAPSIWNREE
jgi:hypothetical protein